MELGQPHLQPYLALPLDLVAAGLAVLTTQSREKEPITFTFCVDDATHGSLTYNAAANVETCDGI